MSDEQIRRVVYQILFGLTVGIAACTLIACFYRMIGLTKTHDPTATSPLGSPVFRGVFSCRQVYPGSNPGNAQLFVNPHPVSPQDNNRTFHPPPPVFFSQSTPFTHPQQPPVNQTVAAANSGTRAKSNAKGTRALASLRKAPQAFLKSFYPPSAFSAGMWGVAPMNVHCGYELPDSAYPGRPYACNPHGGSDPEVQTGGLRQHGQEEDIQRVRDRRSRRMVPRRAVPVMGDDVLPGGQRRGDADPDDHITIPIEVHTTQVVEVDPVPPERMPSNSHPPPSHPPPSLQGETNEDHGALPNYYTDPSLPRYSAEFGPRRAFCSRSLRAVRSHLNPAASDCTISSCDHPSNRDEGEMAARQDDVSSSSNVDRSGEEALPTREAATATQDDDRPATRLRTYLQDGTSSHRSTTGRVSLLNRGV